MIKINLNFAILMLMCISMFRGMDAKAAHLCDDSLMRSGNVVPLREERIQEGDGTHRVIHWHPDKTCAKESFYNKIKELEKEIFYDEAGAYFMQEVRYNVGKKGDSVITNYVNGRRSTGRKERENRIVETWKYDPLGRSIVSRQHVQPVFGKLSDQILPPLSEDDKKSSQF